MRQSRPNILSSSLAGIVVLSVVFGLSTSIVATSATVGLLVAVAPEVHNPRTIQIGNSAKFARIEPYQTFSSNAAQSRKFAREISSGSSS